MSLLHLRLRFGKSFTLIDGLLLLALPLFVYALVGLAHDWAGPFRPRTDIQLGWAALARYSFFSLVRVFIAYFISLLLTLIYGYAAAKSRLAEPILISLLDILQSVPVLGFMPGLVLALVNLFPHSNLGLELAAIIMIFTGQGWNMIFSFYSSLKSVPAEWRDMTRQFRLGRLDVLQAVELPYAANGLLWNSMLSMAGGWFFLMVIESFTLGDRDFRLAGIGSYMAVAYERHDSVAIIAGIITMFVLIVLVDRCLWAPLVVWSERFKFDRDNRGVPPRSLILDWLQRSQLFALYCDLREEMNEALLKSAERMPLRPRRQWPWLKRVVWLLRVAAVLISLILMVYGTISMFRLVHATSWPTWLGHLRDTALTFLRVTIAVVIGSLWTIPVGVFIGMNPRWTQRLQPVVQVVASFPAPMLFPMLVYFLLRAGIGLQGGSIVLMLFASQWYILFNVISGATMIPAQLIDVAQVFRVRGWSRWQSIILPAIFPSLVNGWITAAGGAWNASIVSELVQVGNQTLAATGIGASITLAAQAGDYPRLAGGILVMVTTVVLLNRFFWGALYRLAETRFRVEMT